MDEAVSMCGVVQPTVMLVAALELGATQAKLVKYSTSGDVTVILHKWLVMLR
jgi:AmmeMemoRadiSam system protein B